MLDNTRHTTHNRDMDTYTITANLITRNSTGWEGTRQLPTVLLNKRIQGIISPEHAADIYCELIDSLPLERDVTVSLCVIDNDDTTRSYVGERRVYA